MIYIVTQISIYINNFIYAYSFIYIQIYLLYSCIQSIVNSSLCRLPSLLRSCTYNTQSSRIYFHACSFQLFRYSSILYLFLFCATNTLSWNNTTVFFLHYFRTTPTVSQMNYNNLLTSLFTSCSLNSLFVTFTTHFNSFVIRHSFVITL